MSKMTAEQVADELDRRAESESGDDGCWNVAVAHGDAAKLVRENLIESDGQRRERFERWRRTTWGNLTDSDLERDPDDGTYVSGSVQDQFAVWQAALTYSDEPQRGDA